MKQVFRIDQYGFYIESVIINDNESTPPDCVDVFPTYGLYKPKWNGTDWIEGETTDNILAALKESKLVELDEKCNQVIMGGFSSSALGEQHTYQSMILDEIWFNSTINRFSVDPNFTSVNYKTIDAGYLLHTKEQFIQAFVDGHTFGDSQIMKLNTLKDQVNNATTVEDLEKITW